ncbi:MAG: phage tail tape measure protein [Muribaculaceae bacterium]|nr:phage tail tape measure protein [Muribaculaceae bacterium]
MTGAFKNAFNLVISFGQENSRLAAILGTTRSEIKDMEKAARDLGGSTSYSAAQVTQLQIELAKLGFARQDILDMEAGVLKFATAVGTDLASASAFAGAAMRIFKKDASEAEDVLATFAVATTKTALDFSFLQTSLSTIGPVAASFGFSLEDTLAVLGQLANAGFDASSAATATRNILLNLADSNGKLAQALGQPVKNSADLAAGLRKLRDEGIDLAKALELTDARSVAAFSTFLDNSSELDSLRDSISGVTEEFGAMSDEMADNVAGALASLQSAAEELVLKIAADFEGPMKSVIDGLTSIVQLVGSVVVWLGQYGDKIKAVAIVLGSYKVAMWLCIGAEKTWLALKSAGTVAMKLWTAATKGAAVAMNVVRGNTVAATTAMTALSTAMKTIPWMAVISAVTSLAAMIFTLGKSEDEAAEKTDKLADKTKDFNDALNEAQNNHRREAEAIERLVKVASNELESKEKRLSAIKELNKIIPDYNAGLNAETGAYEANKAALDEYIKSLKQKILLEAHAKKWKELVEADVESRDSLL